MDDYKKRFRELIVISAPLIMENVFIILMGMITTIMVSSVGVFAVPAVSMIDSLSNIIISLFAALTTGGTIVVAQYFGRKEISKATRVGAQAILLSLIFSIIVVILFIILKRPMLTALYGKAEKDVFDASVDFLNIINFSFPMLAITQTIYGILRGSGNTGVPMLISIFMNIANVLLGLTLIAKNDVNFLFLHFTTPGLGIRGAAIALTTARFLGMITSILYVSRHSKTIRINNLKYFKPDWSLQKIVLGLGIPTSVESTLFNVGKLLTQIYIVGMGTFAMAANSIGGSVCGFINVPGTAFSTGVMIIVGQRVGRGEHDDVIKTSIFSIIVGSVFIALICAVCYPLTDSIIGIYNATPETAVYLRQILRTAFIMTPLFWPWAFITPNVLRAAGDVKYTMVIAVVSMWTLRIGLGYIFGITMSMGVVGVWFGMYSDWILRGILFVLRVLSGKWRSKGISASS